MVVLGMTLKAAAPHMLTSMPAILVLAVVMGLLMTSGLVIVAFGNTGTYLQEKWGQVLFGLIVTAIVAGLMVVLGMALKAATPHMLTSMPAILVLVVVMGLLMAAGFAIEAFGEVGVYIQEKWMQILFGLFAIAAVVTGIVGIGIALRKSTKSMTISIPAILVLVVVIGLLMTAGLAIIGFGKIGEYLSENSIYALIGLAGIVVVVAAIVGIGWALSLAMPLMTLTSAAIIPLVIVIGLIIAAGIIIQKLAKLNLGDDVLSNVITNLENIASIGWQLAWLGVQMIPIGVACTLLIAFIQPLLESIALIKVAVLAIEQISEAKIDNAKISDNIGSITTFWTKFKGFISELSIVDLLFLPIKPLTSMVEDAATVIENIAKKLARISAIKLNETTITNTVETIFNCITKIASKIEAMLGKGEDGTISSSILFEVPEEGFLSFFKKKTPTTKDKLDNVKRILATLIGITSGLNEIQKFTLDKDKILNNVDNIFTFISELASSINENLNNKDVFDDNIVNKSTWWGTKKVEEKNPAIEKLDNVSKVICILKNITDSLYSIQKINLKYASNIKSKVDEIFKFIDDLGVHISTNLSGESSVFDDTVEKAHWWSKKKNVENESLTRLDKVSQVIVVLSNITESLKSIQSISIDTQKITDNVELIFGFITKLGTLIQNNMYGELDDKDKWWVKNDNETPTAVDRISDIDKIVSSLGNIMSSLDAISKVKLTEDVKNTINNNIDSMFEYISELTLKVNNLLNPKESILNAETNVLENNVNYAIEKSVADVLNDDKIAGYADKIGAVGNVVKTLSDIVESINKIKNIKLKESDKTKIQQNIELIFGTVIDIVDATNRNLETLEGKSINSEALDPIVNGLQLLNTAFENLCNVDTSNFKKNGDTFAKFISSIATTEIDKDKASIICGTIDSIAVMITESTGTDILEANSRLTLIERLNTAISNFNNTDEASISRGKRTLEGYTKFVEKINTIDIKKLETSAKIFEEMSKLSMSIRGNFDALAESINEDLMPVLKELKEIMEKVPETLETGFQNTNASIGAVNAPPTSENLSNQVKRENPTLTAEDVDRIVRQRLNAIAKNNDESKLDNIIKILQGIGSYAGVKIQPQTY